MTRRTTLFMRIHKTAGEALAKQILDRLPPGVACPEQFEWRVRGLPHADLRRFVFFQGHISPAALNAAFPDLRVFTMVRSPPERLLSCYFYWKEGTKHAQGPFFDALAPLSLLEFLRSENPILRRVTWNVQARLLAGGQFGGVEEQRQNVFGPWLNEEELAPAAIQALDRFAFVGVAEHYQRSLHHAFAYLGLGDPPPPERINVTAARPASYAPLLNDPEIAAELARLTVADRAVYDAVVLRLDGRGN